MTCPYEIIILASKFNIAISVVNIIGACLLIYGTFQLRKGGRMLRETALRMGGAKLKRGRGESDEALAHNKRLAEMIEAFRTTQPGLVNDRWVLGPRIDHDGQRITAIHLTPDFETYSDPPAIFLAGLEYRPVDAERTVQ